MIMQCLRKFLPNFETLYFRLMLSKSWLVARNADALINKLAILIPLNSPTCTNVDHTSLRPGSRLQEISGILATNFHTLNIPYHKLWSCN